MILDKIKYRLSLLRKRTLFGLGLGNDLLKNRYGERILIFHGIDAVGETSYNSRFISQAYLDELLDCFSKQYHVLSLDDFYSKKFKPGVMNIALTFDDGLQNNYELALPVLEKYQMPATFFVTAIYDRNKMLWPDFIDLITYYSTKKEISFDDKLYRKNAENEFSFQGITLKNHCKTLNFEQIAHLYELFEDEWNQIKKSNIDTYWKLMSFDQIKSIAENPLFSIGAHATTHANLEQISTYDASKEIISSKKILEAITGKSVTSFAFPFGTYNEKLVNCCKQNGYSQILLVDYNKNDDRLDAALRDRFVVNPYISKNLFLASLLKGTYR